MVSCETDEMVSCEMNLKVGRWGDMIEEMGLRCDRGQKEENIQWLMRHANEPVYLMKMVRW